MKYFVVFALCVAATSAFAIPPTVTGADAAEIQQIIDAIYHPSTDPATAAALEQMLLEILGINKPVVVEDEVPIVIEPEIIDDSIVSAPGFPDPPSPIDVGPAIIDDSIISEPANYRPPLVQVIVNVNTNAAGRPEQPQPEKPEDVVVVERPEIPEEVVIEQPELCEQVVVEEPSLPEQVVVEKPELPSEPVIIAPIEPIPVITIPDELN